MPKLPLEFPTSRAGAIDALVTWLPHASRYGARRNFVVPGHPNVSRLSPAIGCRLLLEEEVAAAALERFAFSTVEKFVQEVYWRLYWKGWLEMRPAVWHRYRESLARVSCGERERAAPLMKGREGKVAVMDYFARELIETGYLHNHARMWFAGYWVHVARLPWELGADFFLRHLLDGDAAANTLSWRWVAGLHTPGKTYLPRLSNLEKYLDAELLAEYADGLEHLESARVSPALGLVDAVSPPERVPQALAELDEGKFPARESVGRVGLWLHEGDLAVDRSFLAGRSFHAALAPVPCGRWAEQGYSEMRQRYLETAIEDGASRFAKHFGIPVERPLTESSAALVETLASWAEREQLSYVVALRPSVGPVGDLIAPLAEALAARGIGLALRRRGIEGDLFPHARRGFFPFWKHVSKQLRASAKSQRPAEGEQLALL